MSGMNRRFETNRCATASSMATIWCVIVFHPALAVEPPVTALAFAPDGQSVVVGSQAGLAVYGWPGLRRNRQLPTKLMHVHDLEFSPEGKQLAVAGGRPAEAGSVEILAWPDGSRSRVLQGHADVVWDVAWRDESALATASLDHEAALWSLHTGQPSRYLRGHSRGVTTVAYLCDVSVLVTGGLDHNLRVWDPATGANVQALGNHTDDVYQLAQRPREDVLPLIASISADRTVRFWQPTIGRLVRFVRLDAIPLALAWRPDGSQLAVAASDGRVRLVDPDTAEILRVVPVADGWAYSLAAHPTDGSLLVGGREGRLCRVVID
jgi:WD40 repeat protein